MNTPANCLQTLKTMEAHITTHKPVRMRMNRYEMIVYWSDEDISVPALLLGIGDRTRKSTS